MIIQINKINKDKQFTIRNEDNIKSAKNMQETKKYSRLTKMSKIKSVFASPS